MVKASACSNNFLCGHSLVRRGPAQTISPSEQTKHQLTLTCSWLRQPRRAVKWLGQMMLLEASTTEPAARQKSLEWYATGHRTQRIRRPRTRTRWEHTEPLKDNQFFFLAKTSLYWYLHSKWSTVGEKETDLFYWLSMTSSLKLFNKI